MLHGPREPSRSPRRNRLEAADIDQVIAEFNQQSEPSLEAIARAAARHFGLPTSQVRGLSRQRHVALARAVSMYLARELTSQSLQCIGRFFSGRDHTTVLHAWRKIGQQVATDPRLRAAVESIDNVCKPTGRFASDATARSTLTIRARRRKAEH
ncbi:MAG: helix-turn-helix domain-containing protein [Pirellulales bacterium]